MMKKLLKTLPILLLLLVLMSPLTHAYTIPDFFKPINEPFDIDNQLEGGGAVGGTIFVLQIIAGGLLYFAAPIAIIMIVIAGFNMVINGADEEKATQAKSSLTWSAIGLILIILSYSLVRFVISLAIEAASLPTPPA